MATYNIVKDASGDVLLINIASVYTRAIKATYTPYSALGRIHFGNGDHVAFNEITQLNGSGVGLPSNITDMIIKLNTDFFDADGSSGGSGETNASGEWFEIIGGVFYPKLSAFDARYGGGSTPVQLAKSVLTLGTPTATTMPMSWTAVPNATQYIVKWGSTVVYTGTSLTFTHSGLTASTSYSYTVTASAGSAYIDSISDAVSKSTGAGGSDTVVFADNFANTTGVAQPLSTVNWKQYTGNGYGVSEIPQTSTAIKQFTGGSLTTPLNAGYSTVTNLGYMEYADNVLAQLMITDKYSIDLNSITPKKISFALATSVITGSSPATMTRAFVAFKIGSAYYILDAFQRPASASTGNFTTPSVLEYALDFNTPNTWRTLVFVPGGTQIKIGSLVNAALPKGTANFGVYFSSEGIGTGNEGTDGATFGSRTIQLDSYQIIV